MSLLAPTGTVVDEAPGRARRAVHRHDFPAHLHDHAHDHDHLQEHAVESASGGLLHSIDPRVRILACVGFAFLVVCMARIPALGAALLLSVSAAVAAKLDPLPTLRRMLALDGFMVIAFALLPFTTPGERAFAIAGVTASWPGIDHAVRIILRSNAIVLMLLALVATMELGQVGQGMARLGVPEKLVQIFLFAVRYIEVLGREYRRLRTAMKARGFRMRFNLHTWRSIGYLFGMLLVRSIERSQRILAAMRCRGFRGKFHYLVEMRIGKRDRIFAALSLAACLGLLALELA